MDSFATLYKEALFSNVISFWENHSVDWKNGGYFSCLDRSGKIYDTDKFIWLQGRQAWTFSMLYNEVEKNPAWLNISQNGITFLEQKARNPKGKFYFSTMADGRPLVAAYNIFSDCFATMAFAQYGKATQDAHYMNLAKSTFDQILARQSNPKGKYEKKTGNRPLKGFSLPMILSNLVLELEHILDSDTVEHTLDQCIHEVMQVFRDKESGLIYENVYPDGKKSDCFDGRLLNPGHGIEAMWFMMDIAKRRQDQTLMDQAISSVLSILDYAWDPEFGGIFYFMDSKGHPPQQLEWDQKLWWVHLETLVALAKAYEHKPSAEIKSWLQKVHNYSWQHFADPENDEWFGYLNRRGEVLLDLKGGKWKGCFHVPRALYQCYQSFEKSNI
ncbi:AGE family epimerase/isomerase [Sediminicola luteus]|uniref:N-acylglucosamine 2-epimerase n=1 Tax=Sediminicola luteus TaxID=319238 RepID=A0A2A4G5L1_9FLAO|nr:AGE family epimerase/isomerase [Sediminicola luteus]PCE63035.1 N-acylglucosamine 2-epimerase [Sediminicola luteus]